MSDSFPKARSKFKAKAVPKPRHDTWIYFFLLGATLAVYSQTRTYEFVTFEDPSYVSANPHVSGGLTRESVAWAFSANHLGYWIPLTWLSHMIDWQLFGNRSGLHHLTSVLLHSLSTLLLFALLRRLTGSRWRSAFVAFLFSLHPLHVESVAWVSARKDVLCGVFFFLTLWAYALYVERPSRSRYALVLVLFCLGLMSKPVIVTLPFVLLLLDVWPLRRIAVGQCATTDKTKASVKQKSGTQSAAALLREKTPLFALAAVSSAITYMTQASVGAVQGWIPIGTRFGNAVTSYIVYIAQVFWPEKLAVFYQHPLALPLWQILGACGILLAVSVLVVRSTALHPYLAVGWFWYLGTLVPVIGLIQAGIQARADRFTYIPLIGILLILAWGLPDLWQRWPRAQSALAGTAILACSASVVVAWHQVQTWQDSASLYQRDIEVSPGSYLGYYGLGGLLRDQGQLDESIAYYREAVRLAPTYPNALVSLASVLLNKGRVSEAIMQFSEALRLSPGSVPTIVELGVALQQAGRTSEAIARFREAIRISPEYALAHYDLGTALISTGNTNEALTEFTEAVRLDPSNPEPHFNLGNLFVTLGKMTEAVAEFSAAVQLKPDYVKAQCNLGSALANLGHVDDAIPHFREALRLKPDFSEAGALLEQALSIQARRTTNK